MKIFIYFTTFFFAIMTQVCFSQNLIAVQNGSSTSFYTSLNLAFDSANPGDTVYIPSGPFLAADISKRLHIIGIGHNPDSAAATGISVITGDLLLYQGASGGTLTGVKCNKIILFDTISNYSVRRCNIEYFEQYSSLNTYMVQNCFFIENIVRNQYLTYYTKNNFISNNIFVGYVYIGRNNTIRNNIFMEETNSINTVYSTIENNIFLSPANNPNFYFNIVSNNLFVQNIDPSFGENIFHNNFMNIPHSSIFVNQMGYDFNYSHNYHLQPSCVGKGAGIDGTDIGIYGGAFPWKDGSVPFNPHFLFLQNTHTTDSIGNLHINIKVAAQDR
ncbi:MAG: hypothetical protein FD155_1812 [Bacteroidetes bacterium]|nr:MAG: hypothetical protein FD155_1812 [Bacteroidota bacterium]